MGRVEGMNVLKWFIYHLVYGKGPLYSVSRPKLIEWMGNVALDI